MGLACALKDWFEWRSKEPFSWDVVQLMTNLFLSSTQSLFLYTYHSVHHDCSQMHWHWNNDKSKVQVLAKKIKKKTINTTSYIALDKAFYFVNQKVLLFGLIFFLFLHENFLWVLIRSISSAIDVFKEEIKTKYLPDTLFYLSYVIPLPHTPSPTAGK